MNSLKVFISYEFSISLEANSEEEFNKNFEKLREIIEKDVEKFIFSNIDNKESKRKIFFELEEGERSL